MKRILSLLAFFLLAACSVLAQTTPVPPLLNFQGRLAKPDSTPVPDGTYSITFSLFTAATGGTQNWTETLSAVHVHNGVFAVLLGKTTALTDSVFAGNVWLEIKVGSDPALTPRQPLVSVAYAFKANTVPDNAITASKIKDASITASKLASGVLNPIAWLVGGNSGTNGTQFLGTTDNQPLTFKVNGRQAMRYSYAENTSVPGSEYRSINVLGGSAINSIAPGVVGATIGGGGQDNFTGTGTPNQVTADFGTVGGGSDNTASGNPATVAGGYANTASGDSSTVAGGEINTASNSFSTVAGGIINTASGDSSTVAGGYANTASGDYAAIAGGNSNIAAGNYSFAAGYSAQALQDGCFVWADFNPNEAAFASTGPNQFCIRAAGGVKLCQGTTLELGFGVAGKEPNAGKIGYATFTPDTLDIVGAGPQNGTRQVKVWAEGGTTFTGNIHVNGITYTSDARFKTDIAPCEKALETILNLRGVRFAWNRARWKDRGFASGPQIGFLAQEVERVVPELVSTDAQGYKSVAYVNVVPLLVEAMKQQQGQITVQAKQMQSLASENARLKSRLRRVDALQSQLSSLSARLAQVEAQQARH
jgi:hypothetical protein